MRRSAALVLAGVALGAGVLAPSRAQLRAITWIAPGHELEVLTSQPAICREPAGDERQFAAGRALFNAPFLLGGQAARSGISCASCHSNGRRNPHFFLAGVSLAPGTADVSSSFFSPARGNATFDPRPIPDLALPGKVSRDRFSAELELFLRGLIVEEFAGREPGAASLSALADYVRAIGPCPGGGAAPVELSDQLGLLRDSLGSAAWMAQRGESEAAAVLVSGARHQLGLIHERFAGRGLGAERRMLLAASRRLQPLADAGAPDAGLIEAWLADFDAKLAPRLERKERRSLYETGRLDRYLQESR